MQSLAAVAPSLCLGLPRSLLEVALNDTVPKKVYQRYVKCSVLLGQLASSWKYKWGLRFSLSATDQNLLKPKMKIEILQLQNQIDSDFVTKSKVSNTFIIFCWGAHEFMYLVSCKKMALSNSKLRIRGPCKEIQGVVSYAISLLN